MNQLADKNLDPTVAAFKQFINSHPALIKDIRKHGQSWQDLYEKWVLLDEDDPYWDPYKTVKEEKQTGTKEKEKNKHAELFGQLIKLSENIDVDKLQNQVHQLNNTITTIQEVITQYQQSKNKSTSVQKPTNWLQD